MAPRHLRPVLRYVPRAGYAGACSVAILLFAFAAPALADSIRVDSYDAWCWNGFSRSLPPETANDYVAGTSLASGSSVAASTTSTTSTALTTASTSSSDPTTSLSGYVYFDVNPDGGGMTTDDWAIADAKIAITRDSDSPIITYTQEDGSYTVDGLLPGAYSISLLTLCELPGQSTLGVLRDADGNLVTAGQVDATQQRFYDIVLDSGYTGEFYNFADLAYPVGLISKRMVLNTDGIEQHTIPEPGSLALLAMAGLFCGGWAWRRRSQAQR